MPNFDELQVLLSEGQPAGATAKTLAGAAGYQLLYESQIVDDTPPTTQRVYLAVGGGENGAIVHTHNARWNGSQWVRDATADSFKIILPNITNPALSISSVYPSASASPWGDGSWQDIKVEGADAGQRGFIQLLGNLPIGTAPATNALSAMNICKAWALLEYNGLGPSYTNLDSFNISAVGVVTGVSGYLTVTFHSNMSTATYSAVAMDHATAGSIDRRAKATNLATTGLRIYLLDATGTIIDPSTIQGTVSLQVFARQ